MASPELWRFSASPTPVRWVIVVALLVGAVLRLCPELGDIPPVIHDAAEYRHAARHLLATGAYDHPFREPLLPFLLAVSELCFGPDLVLQLRLLGGLSVLAMIVTLATLQRTLRRGQGWLAAAVIVLLAVDGDQLIYGRELSTVPLHALLLVTCAWALARGVTTSARWPWAVAGIAIGLAALSRGSWLGLALVGAGCTVSLPRPRWPAAAILLASTAVVAVPWMVRNQIEYGFFAPAASSGVHVFTRTYHLMPEGRHGSAVREAARRHRRELPPLSGAQMSETVKWLVFSELLDAGWSLPEIDREFLAVSIENVRAKPAAYARETAMMAARILGTYDFTWLGEDLAAPMRRPLREQLQRGAWGGVLQKLVFRVALPLLSAAALLCGMVLGWRRRRRGTGAVSALATAVVAMLALGAPATGVRRYRSEVDGLLLAAVASGAGTLLGRRAAVQAGGGSRAGT